MAPCEDGAMGEAVVLPADAPKRAELETQGWTVTARSFGAQLDTDRIDEHGLRGLVSRAAGAASIRELDAPDIEAVLALDAATIEDYPGSLATQHLPLDRHKAVPSETRRAFGAFEPTGDLIAMTFVDIDGTDAETDFTVVHRVWRGLGLGTAVKAASVLKLGSEGVKRFRTGGSAENAAILRANDALGYIRDEAWVTLEHFAR